MYRINTLLIGTAFLFSSAGCVIKTNSNTDGDNSTAMPTAMGSNTGSNTAGNTGSKATGSGPNGSASTTGMTSPGNSASTSSPSNSSGSTSTATPDARCAIVPKLNNCSGQGIRYAYDKSQDRCIGYTQMGCETDAPFTDLSACTNVCGARGLWNTPGGIEVCNAQEIANLDPVNISTAKLDGKNLVLEVSYSGGCFGVDNFKLCWNGKISNTAPAVLNAVLLHDAYGDKCEALENDTLRFDLSPLDSNAQSNIEIHIGQKVVPYSH